MFFFYHSRKKLLDTFIFICHGWLLSSSGWRDVYNIVEKAFRGFDTAFAPTTSPRARSAQHRVEVITRVLPVSTLRGKTREDSKPQGTSTPPGLAYLMPCKHNSWGMQITQHYHNLLLYYRERIRIIIWCIRKRRNRFIAARALDLRDFTFPLSTPD